MGPEEGRKASMGPLTSFCSHGRHPEQPTATAWIHRLPILATTRTRCSYCAVRCYQYYCYLALTNTSTKPCHHLPWSRIHWGQQDISSHKTLSQSVKVSLMTNQLVSEPCNLKQTVFTDESPYANWKLWITVKNNLFASCVELWQKKNLMYFGSRPPLIHSWRYSSLIKY